ncbi:MAG TPA: aldo/keto reductase [Solirubrobacteraceae bacterium]|jgi:hypothetical protein
MAATKWASSGLDREHCVSDISTPVGRLALGTAQLGMPYGVANRRGQPSADEAEEMLEYALRGGIRCLDTAGGYGDAESVIGRHLRARAAGPDVAVVTKLAPLSEDAAGVTAALAASRRRLGFAPTAALLHDPRQIAGWEGPLGAALRDCRALGQVQAIGVSVYTPEQFALALELQEIDLVQAPMSVLDRRIERAGLLERARTVGVSVMLRSVFLQGLLLLPAKAHPQWLGSTAAPLARWRELCERYEVAPQHAALRFVLQRTAPAGVVVGCESVGQLRELLAAAGGPELAVELVADLEELAELAGADARLIDPRSWPV